MRSFFHWSKYILQITTVYNVSYTCVLQISHIIVFSPWFNLLSLPQKQTHAWWDKETDDDQKIGSLKPQTRWTKPLNLDPILHAKFMASVQNKSDLIQKSPENVFLSGLWKGAHAEKKINCHADQNLRYIERFAILIRVDRWDLALCAKLSLGHYLGGSKSTNQINNSKTLKLPSYGFSRFGSLVLRLVFLSLL